MPLAPGISQIRYLSVLAKVLALYFLAYMALFAQAGTASSSTSYILAAGDQIQIAVYQEDDLTMAVRLDETGIITYPYLGKIQATGITTEALQELITLGLLDDVLIKPSVNVSVISYRNYYIGGEVKNPGGYAFQPGLTVRQAITVAGGLSEWGSDSKIEILRENSNTPIQADHDSLVGPGDTITVKQGLF